jgi:tape measure domain-containing protein
MSTTIDQKVVEMKFDNKQFENGAKESLGTIDRLKKSLNFDGISKGLDNVGSSAKNINMSGLSSALDTVQVKFSAMQVIGMTALSNITTSAMHAGESIVKSFTIDPVKTGFQEYETQINAVQTILANTSSKGTTLDNVNAALDELNTYADKTIYNFTEMTRNIGTFTAAGIDLDTSVSAIQGIANLAAVSGSNAQQASTAMYQLSQALASGSVKLMDWNSVVNAGMGGEVFQNALKDTARLHGVAIDEMIKNEGSFRETLKDGWITSEVLTETLNKFTTSGVNDYLAGYTGLTAEAIASMREQAVATSDVNAAYKEMATSLAANSTLSEDQIYQLLSMSTTAEDAATKVKTFSQLMDTMKEAVQSGWTQTWELLIGDFEEAKTLFTEISDMFGGIISKSADERNSLLKGALTSNWDNLQEKITETGIANEDFQNALIQTAKDHNIAIDDMIAKEGSFAKTLKTGWLNSELISETLNKFIGNAAGVSSATADMTGKLEEFQGIVNGVIKGDFGNGEDRVKGLTDAGYDYAAMQGFVNKVINGGTLTIEDLSTAQLENIGYTEDQIKAIQDLAKQAEETGTPLNEMIEKLYKPTGRELLVDSFRNILKGLITSITAVKTAWSEVFPPMSSDQLYNVIDGIHTFSEGLNVSSDDADKLRRTFKGLFSILDIFVTFAGGGFRIAFKILTTVLGMADMNILDLTSTIGDALVAFDDWLFKNNAVIKGVTNMGGVVLTTGKKIKTWIDSFVELPKVQISIGRFNMAFSDALSNIKSSMSDGIVDINKFIKYIQSLDSITLDDLPKIFEKLEQIIFKRFDKIGDGFTDIRKSVSDFKDDIISNFTKTGESADNLLGKFINFAVSVRNKLTDTIGLGEILTIGVGAGLIVFVKKIGDALETIAGPIGNIIGILDGLEGVLKGYAKKLKAEALLKVAIAIGILAVSIALLTQLDQGKMWSAVGALGVLSIGLLAVVTALGYIGKIGGSTKGSITLTGIAISVLLLATAMQKLDDLNPSNIVRNIEIMAALALGLVGLAGILGIMSPQMAAVTLIPLGFALALNLLVTTLSKMDSMELQNADRSLELLAKIAIGLAVVSRACKGVKAGAALTVVAIAISLKMLVGVFEDIGKLDLTKMKENMGAFIAIFGTFGILMVLSKFAGANAAKAGIGILAMSAALLLIVQAFKMINGLSDDEINRSMGVITSILIVFGAIVALSKFAGEHAIKAGVMLLLMSVAIVILAGVIVALSHVKPEGLNRALGAVLMLGVMFGALIAVTNIAKNVKGTLVLLAITIGILAIALGTLSMIEPDKLAGATKALSTVIASFAILVASTGLAKKAQISLLTMTIVVGALAAMLYLLSGLPTGKAMEASKALSILLLSLSASILILNFAGSITPQAIIAAAAMTGIVAVLAIIIGLLAASNVGSTLEIAQSLSILLLSLSASCLILAAVGLTGPAGLIGIGILAALIVGIGGLLVGIGALVDKFPQLEVFLNKGIPILEAIGYALGSFFGNMVGGFAAGATAGLPEIGTNLSIFMTNMQPFFDGAASVDASSVNAMKAIAEMVLILTAADILQGLAGWLTGGSSLVQFGQELATFAPYFNTYWQYTKGITGSVLETSANAAKAIAVFATAIPNNGGFISLLTGDNSLAKFGAELALFGPNLKLYADSISGLDGEVVANSASAAQVLSDFATKIPNSGGLVSLFTGENSIDKFGKQLVSFGKSMADYSRAVTNVNGAQLIASVEAFTHILDFAKLTADVDAAGLASFNYSLSSIGSFGVESFIEGFIKSEDKVKNAAESMVKSMSDKVDSKKSTVVMSFVNMLTDSINQMNQLYSAFEATGIYLVKGFVNGIYSQIQAAANAAASMARAAANAADKEIEVASPSKVTYKTGAFFGAGFVNAITDYSKKAYSAGSDIASNASTGLSNAISKVSTFLNGDMDTQPTIRPVLDLSNVQTGMSTLNNMFNKERSLAAYATVSGINQSMKQNQNGSNNDDVVSAINKLQTNMKPSNGDTCVINGLTYDDGSNITSTVSELVRAVKVTKRR